MRMKTFIASLLVFCSLACFAQKKSGLESIESVTFYGVDFSNVKVSYAHESPEDFIMAFERINELFISEYEKYVSTLSNRLDIPVSEVNIDWVLAGLDGLDRTGLVLKKTVPPFTEEQIAAAVAGIDTGDETGTGLVILANSLNKAQAEGRFTFVFFDKGTKQVIASWDRTGNARGFGLRNYWAGALYNAIKRIVLR